MKHHARTVLHSLTLLAMLALAACGSTPQVPQQNQQNQQPQPSAPTLTLASNQSEIVLPGALELAATPENLGEKTVSKLEYFAGDQKIGESAGSFTWNATPENTSIAEGASGTLSLSAKASLSDGSSLSSNTVNVQASSASSGFSLILEPSGVALQNGQSVSVTLKRANLNGFNGDVAISLVNPPAGIAAEALTIQDGDSEGTLNISASGAVVGGPFEVSVKGVSGGKSTSVPLAVTVKAAPEAGAPELYFTLDKSIITTPETVNLNSSVGNLGSKTVNKVEFFRGATKIGEDASAPYSLAWNASEQSTGVAAGNTQIISLIAKATLSDGSSLTSSLQNLKVIVPAAPKLEATLEPFSVSVQQGKSSSVFLNIKRINIKGDVAVSLKNPPAGISLVPVTIFEGSSGSLVVIKVDQGAVLGPKNLTVQASLGNLTANANLQLTVTAPVSSGSYTLSVVASSVSVEQGKSVNVPVKINRIGGYNKDVKLFAGIIPPGVTAKFEPGTLSGNQTDATLTLAASDDALAETPAQFAVFSQAQGELVQVNNFTLTVGGIHGKVAQAANLSNTDTVGRVASLGSGGFAMAMMGKDASGYYAQVGTMSTDLAWTGGLTLSRAAGVTKYGYKLSSTHSIWITGFSAVNNRLYVSGCAHIAGPNGLVYNGAQAFVAAFIRNTLSGLSVDTSFGDQGIQFKVMYGGNYDTCAHAIAADSNGIYLAGQVASGLNRIGVARFTPVGLEDNGFDTDGTLTTAIPNTSLSIARAACKNGAEAIVAGSARDGTGRDRSVVLNYAPDGKLDTSFSGDGIVAFDPDQGSSGVMAMACDVNKVVTVGYARTASGKSNFAVARLDGSGNLDKNFGGDGMVTTTFGPSHDVARDVALLPDGSILVAGYTTGADGKTYGALVKYNPDGTLAQGFGIGGKVALKGAQSTITGLALKANGNIVVVTENGGAYEFTP